jgi:hypothetical protein
VWQDNYRFIAVYIQQGIPDNRWTGTYIYEPKIAYVNDDNNILDEIDMDTDALNATLKKQSIFLGV